jgi:alkylation response protein AidB-like acyl-CoA dehydrogenase
VRFDLSDDQLALRAAARALLDDECSPARVRAAVDAGGVYDRQLWKAMIAQGWTDLAGAELGWVEAAVLLEEVGAHVAPAPILSQLVAAEALGGTPWADAVRAGEAVACVAASGGREVVPYAPAADVAVCVAGDAVVAIALDGAVAAEPAMDVTRELGWLDPSRRGEPLAIGVDRFVDLGALAYSAELLGLSQRMLDVTVQYAKDRVQFGQPIGSFQAVKHRCADMLVDVEGMRSAVYYAAWCLAARDRDASVAASTAKTWCSDAAMRVMGSALQVHGGIGFTWEHDVHLYLKRAQLDALCFGDATWHRTRLARLLRARVDAGESVL